MLSIGAGLRELAKKDPGDYAELLPFDKAWPLALLLSSWYLVRSRREPELTPQILGLIESIEGARVIWRVLDKYAEILLPACQKAYEAKESWDIAEAGGAFGFAATKIGPFLLRAALSSPQFATAASAVIADTAAPAGLADEFSREVAPASPLPRVAPGEPAPSGPAPSPSGDLPHINMTSTALGEADHCSIFLRSQLGITDDGMIQKLCAGPSKTPFLLIFGGDAHHVFGTAFEREVLQAPDVAERLRRFIVLSYQLNPDADLRAYRSLRITAFPTVVALLGQREIARLVGYPNYGEFMRWLDSLGLPASAPTEIPPHKIPAESQPVANPVPPVQIMPVAQGASDDVVRLFAALQEGNLSPAVERGYRETLRNLGYLV